MVRLSRLVRRRARALRDDDAGRSRVGSDGRDARQGHRRCRQAGRRRDGAHRVEGRHAEAHGQDEQEGRVHSDRPLPRRVQGLRRERRQGRGRRQLPRRPRRPVRARSAAERGRRQQRAGTAEEAWPNCRPSFDAGVAASKAQNCDEAIAAFQKAAAAAPNCHDCYYNIGYAYFQKKDYANAEAAYKKATELKPDYVEAWNALANVYNVREEARRGARGQQQGGGALAGRAAARPAQRAAAAAATPRRSTTRASSSGTSRSTPRPRTSSRRPRRPIRSTARRNIGSGCRT